jgi:hypothetical protein
VDGRARNTHEIDPGVIVETLIFDAQDCCNEKREMRESGTSIRCSRRKVNAGRSRTSSSIVDRSIMLMLSSAFSRGSPVTTSPTNQAAAAALSHITADSVTTAATKTCR